MGWPTPNFVLNISAFVSVYESTKLFTLTEMAEGVVVIDFIVSCGDTPHKKTIYCSIKN